MRPSDVQCAQYGSDRNARRSRCSCAGIAQTLAQSIQLVAVERAARGVAADRLPYLRGAGQALHRARGLVEIEARVIEGQAAEVQQAAHLGVQVGDQRFVLKVHHANRIFLQPETRETQEVDAV